MKLLAQDLGNAALKAGDFDLAIKKYTEAIELEPNEAVYHSNRSAAQCKAQNYQQALMDADECIRLRKSWARGYNRKAS